MDSEPTLLTVNHFTKHYLDSAINNDHHTTHELDTITTDISNATSPRSNPHSTSASVGEQLPTPLTIVRLFVTELEPVTPPTHGIRVVDTTSLGNTTINHIIQHCNDQTIIPVRIQIPNELDHHDQVIDDDITKVDHQLEQNISAKSITNHFPQSYRHTIPLESIENIFNSTSNNDGEISGGRNEIGEVWETKDVGEKRDLLVTTDNCRVTSSNTTDSELQALGRNVGMGAVYGRQPERRNKSFKLDM
jgi:hypothetical protein